MTARNWAPTATALACGIALLPACSGSSTAPTASLGPSAGFAGGGGIVSRASPPSFGAIETAGSPPPISGGTLLVTFDGTAAVASDPDRDVLDVVSLTSNSLAFTIALQPGDEPGRLAEDSAGRVHVALRGGGALVTVDPRKGTVIARRPACPAPRGVAWAASSDLVWVACATGELVALPAGGGPAVRSFVVERDLRDVIAQPDGTLTVSKFRSAELLHIGGDGAVVGRRPLPLPPLLTPSAAQVAWRTIAGLSPGSTVAVYQLESTANVSTSAQGGYSGGGGLAFAGPGGGLFGLDAGPPPGGFFGGAPPGVSVPDASVPLPSLGRGIDGGRTPIQLPGGFGGAPIASALTVLDNYGSGSPLSLGQTVLPVDVALSPDGTQLAICGAGTGFGSTTNVWLLSSDGQSILKSFNSTKSPVVAVAFDGRGHVIAQTLEPAALLFIPTGAFLLMDGDVQSVALFSDSRHNTGSDIFHTQAGGMIACASCHPEGGDDGHVWMLDGLPRRTPSLRGTIAGTAPYHWPGDELDMSMLIDDVYTRRMSGARLALEQQQVLTKWVEGIPAPPAPSWVDANAAQRGQVLFEGPAGCSTCHSGAKFTNNATVDVGTGHDVGTTADGGAPPTAFQVPPLVGVGWRTPLLHDGCAATIADRFGSCATQGHGSKTQLSSQDIADLTAYLESL